MIKKYFVIANKDYDGYDEFYTNPPVLFEDKDKAEQELKRKKNFIESRLKPRVNVERTFFGKSIGKASKISNLSDDEIRRMKWFLEKGFVKGIIVEL
ncbi:hypothetical protein POP12_184 [Pectobacterium phage POP12]|nr:hypothetical protein POP12_184 [Pectobacterium phage POP12]